ncbi:hypothetical protein SAMN04515620_10540 [Collimonas sp. OK607]|nr:hypothetical protein SAMN04515620_10540 [Collimonas sp. OK607]
MPFAREVTSCNLALHLYNVSINSMTRETIVFLNWARINYAGLASIAASILCLAYNAWRVWQEWRGIGELCYSCSMPASYHSNGKYGPYFKCWNCGTNREEDNFCNGE